MIEHQVIEHRCRFCGEPAVARYAMAAGCVCHPGDREQDLCVQHENRSEPLGGMALLWTYDPGGEGVGG